MAQRPDNARVSPTDVIINVKPVDMEKILQGTQNHIFRNLRLPESTHRVWLYVGSPLMSMAHYADVGGAKTPGDIDPYDLHAGNNLFNQQSNGNFAYEILHLYLLHQELSLEQMKQMGFVNSAPAKCQFVRTEMMEFYPLGVQQMLY